jgi:hypothetical protein
MNDKATLTLMQREFVTDAYVKPADRNYVLGRHALKLECVFDGFWLIAQCFEKYLKASLLLNGRPAKQGHQLNLLFQEHSSIFGDVLPSSFLTTGPTESIFGAAPFDTIAELIQHIEFIGSPSNRYSMVGYIHEYRVLLRIDEAVYWIRRNCRHAQSGLDFLADGTKWELDPTFLLERCIAGETEPLAPLLFDQNLWWLSVRDRGRVGVGIQPFQSYQAGAIQCALASASGAKDERLTKLRFLQWLQHNVTLSAGEKPAVGQMIADLTAGNDSP